TGNGARDAFGLHGAQGRDISHTADAATGDDGDAQGLGQLHGGVDIDAVEHTVATDVGVDDAFDAIVLELLAEVDDVMTGQLGPTVHRHLAVLGVEADDDMAGEGTAGIMQEAGVLDRGRTDDDIADTVIEAALDGIQIADAATELNRDLVADLFQNCLDGSLILRLARKGAIEVDQMQTAGALVYPVARHGGGLFRENGGIVHIALFEADTVTVFQINRGYEQHSRSTTLAKKGWKIRAASA